MQPTGIQPSQLLMEVMASAKEKIGQEICRSDFSQQLHEQHRLAQNAPLGPSAAAMLQPLNVASDSSPALSQSSLVQPSENGSRLGEATAIIKQVPKGSTPAAPSTKNLALSKWRLSQELTFTDTSALEKVLAQYQLAPSVNTTIRNALDEEGRISLQKLTQILDRVSTTANEAAPDGRAAAEEIQFLLTAVLQQKQLPAQALKSLAIPSKASYDFGEFRDLLRQFVDQTARASVKQTPKSAKSPLPQTTASDPATAEPLVETSSSSRARLPNQTKSLTTNLIPSFSRDSRGPFDNFNSHLSAGPTAVPVSSETTRNEILTADEPSRPETPPKSWQRVSSSNGTVITAAPPDTRNAADWLSGVREWPQALQELISRIVPENPRVNSHDPATLIEARLPNGPAPMVGVENDLVQQVHITLDATTMDKQGVPLSSAGVLASASSAGATAFWAMRSTPAENDLILDANSAEQTMAFRSTVPVVEKIAASTAAGFTSPDPGTSGGRDATLNSSFSPAQQDARYSAGAVVEPFTSNHAPEASTASAEETPDAPTDLHTASAVRPVGDAATVLELSTGMAPRAVFRDGIHLHTTTRMDVPSTDTPPMEPVETQTLAEAPPMEPVETQTLAEVPSALRRPQVTLAAAIAGTDAPPTEPVKAQTPAEVPSALRRPQVTLAAAIAGTDAPPTEPVKAQAPAEVPSPLRRPQNTLSPDAADDVSSMLRPIAGAQPERPAPSPPVAAFQSEEMSPMISVEGEFSLNRATSGKSNTRQAEQIEHLARYAPRASFSQPALSSTENPQQADSVISTKVEIASPAAPAATVPSPEAPTRSPMTAAIPGPGVPEKLVSEMPIDSQPPKGTADFTAPDDEDFFPGDPTLAETITAVPSDERSRELSGLTQGSSVKQSLKPVVSDTRSADPRQEPLSSPNPLTGMDSTPLPGREAVVPSPDAGITTEDFVITSSNPAAKNPEQAPAANPSRTTSPIAAAENTGMQTAAGQAVSAKESETGFQNSIELLAKGTVDSEAIAGKPTPVSPEAVERTTRHNPLETGSREVSADMKGEKAVPVPQGSEQSPRQGQGQDQGQDHPSTWFRNDFQMATLAANPSADKAAEFFSSYTSSLTAELAQRIQELHRQKRHELTLELQPEQLGRLRVRIGTDDNQVSALISTESEQVKELLNRGSAALRQELASQGLVLDKFQIDVNSQGSTDEHASYQQGSGSRRNGSHQQAPSAGKGFAEPGTRRSAFGHANSLISLFV